MLLVYMGCLRQKWGGYILFGTGSFQIPFVLYHFLTLFIPPLKMKPDVIFGVLISAIQIPFDFYEAIQSSIGTPSDVVISIGLPIRTLVLLFMFE